MRNRSDVMEKTRCACCANAEDLRLFFFFFIKKPCFFIIAVGTMFAAAFATITTLQMVFLGKNNIAFRACIKILGLQRLVKHFVKSLERLIQAFDGATNGFGFLHWWLFPL
jgi:hypothetical protein